MAQIKRWALPLAAFFSVLGGLLYRAGGASGWNTKFRDLGVSACVCGILALKTAHIWPWLALIPTFGLTMAALTTYRYFLPKPKDYTGWHYALHGFFCAFGAVCYAWAVGGWIWLWFGVRCAVCAIGVGLWSWKVKNDVVEEIGRGVIITGSTALLWL